LDYILVRPPAPENSLDYVLPPYVLKRHEEKPIWEAPWPAADFHACGPPPDSPVSFPERLSDHRPVIGNFELVALREPPNYHPNWRHDYAFQVTSINATGTPDCWLDLCAPADPYVILDGSLQLTSGGETFIPGAVGARTECEGWTLSVEGDACMADWGFEHMQDPEVHFAHVAGASARDADDVDRDDVIDVIEPGHFLGARFIWPSGEVEMRALPGPAVPEGWFDYATIYADPIEWCTRDEPQNMCIEIRLDELEP